MRPIEDERKIKGDYIVRYVLDHKHRKPRPNISKNTGFRDTQIRGLYIIDFKRKLRVIVFIRV